MLFKSSYQQFGLCYAFIVHIFYLFCSWEMEIASCFRAGFLGKYNLISAIVSKWQKEAAVFN